MKKAILLCGMLLALTASVAAAAPGLALRWTKCFGEPGSVQNRAFGCNLNTGAGTTHILVGSFKLGTDLLQVSGNEVVVDLAAAAPTLPAWWAFKNAGTCRQLAISPNFTADASNIVCSDWAAGQASGGIGAYNIGARGPNTARLTMAIAVPPAALQDLLGGLDYFSFNLSINSTKTIGTGTQVCLGCQTPVCIIFNSLNVTTPETARNVKLSGPLDIGSDFATWQGGGLPVVGNITGCPEATPAQNKTWGQVKSLYR